MVWRRFPAIPAPPSTTNASPYAMPNMPSVATSGLTRSFTTTNPLTSPTPKPEPMAARMAREAG